jgi:murein DD-endopeptidase MepM/ murein hydrolase activator NlpD
MARIWILIIVVFSTFGSLIPGILTSAHGLETNDTDLAFVQNLNPSERIAQIKTKIETKSQTNLTKVSSFSVDFKSVKSQAVANEPWRLPFVAKTRMYQTQGYDGPYSHQGVKALDLVATDGVIVAAKSGTVSTVEVGGKFDGWCNSNSDCYNKGGIWRGNNIVITHSDGSSSFYLHLKPGSIYSGIAVGRYIDQGTPLAVQGSTGYTCNANCSAPYSHLHFQVNKNGVSIPTPFDDCNYVGNQCDINGIPQSDRFYTSTNYPIGYAANIQDKTINMYAGSLNILLNGINRGDGLSLGYPNQNLTTKWSWYPSGEIRGLNDWCLAVGSNSNIVISDCNGQDNQKWLRGSRNSIVSRSTGQCWDSERGESFGSRVYLFGCHGGRNQQWRYGSEGYPTEKLNEDQ